MDHSSPAKPLTKERMLGAFRELDERLKARGVHGEVCLLGGAAMCLAYDARDATMDVDAIVTPADDVLQEALMMSGDESGLPPDWLNSAARAYLSHQVELQRTPCYEFGNLRVFAAPPEYLLAMKVRASRMPRGATRGDADDIATLLRILNIEEPEEAWRRVEAYYPPEKFPKHARALLEDVCQSRQWGRQSGIDRDSPENERAPEINR